MIGKVAVGGGARQVLLSPGGKFVVTHASGKVALIDTRTNEKLVEHEVEGKVKTIQVDGDKSRILALTSKSLLVLDAEKGNVLATVEGFSQPQLIVRPN